MVCDKNILFRKHSAHNLFSAGNISLRIGSDHIFEQDTFLENKNSETKIFLRLYLSPGLTAQKQLLLLTDAA